MLCWILSSRSFTPVHPEHKAFLAFSLDGSSNGFENKISEDCLNTSAVSVLFLQRKHKPLNYNYTYRSVSTDGVVG